MSFSLRASLSVIGVIAVLASPLVARADMPGNGDRCEMQEGCVQCEDQSDGSGPDAEYDSCVAAAEADDLSLSCSELQGSSSLEFWCPEGVDANAGCTAAAGPATQGAAFLLSCVAALGLSLARRRTRK